MGTRYAPLLKAKPAEIEVLSEIEDKADIIPIFELQEAPQFYIDKRTQKEKNKYSTATHASYFVDCVARRWNSPMFVDIHRVVGDRGPAPWWRLLLALTEMGPAQTPLPPVIHSNDDAEAISSAAPLAQGAQAAALRVALPHANISVLSNEISSVASLLSLPTESITVILDWGNRLEEHRLDDIEEGTRIAVDLLKDRCADIITLGTPNDDGCKQAGDWPLPRKEWWLWLRLQDSPSAVIYGDYALYPPTDPGGGRPSYGHLRYSHEDTLWVHRRGKPKEQAVDTPANLEGAFRLCCRHLTRSTHFYGADFSPSDQEIQDIANDVGPVRNTPGSTEKWREISFKHHLALVTRQLAAPPEPPPAGTE